MDNFEHSHCPNDCEHPQSFKTEDEKEYCGCCYFMGNELREMIPCVPETCGELA